MLEVILLRLIAVIFIVMVVLGWVTEGADDE